MDNKYLKTGLFAFLIIALISGLIMYNNKINSISESSKKVENFKTKNDNSQGNIGVNIGNFAPDFNLSRLSGGQVNLSDFQGKYVMLNFWATWCPPCRAEMPDLNEFYQENKDDFIVVGVNIGESKEKVKSFMEKNGYKYPILLDQTKEIASMYQTSVIPTSYFIDPTGKIQYVKKGIVSKAELNQIKENLMNKNDK